MSYHVSDSVTVNCPPDMLYQYWRRLSNLPSIMSNLKEVREADGRRSHWIAKGPLNTDVEWDAEITQDEPGRSLSWHSIKGSEVDTSGTVRFQPAGSQGTEVQVTMDYRPPLGVVGQAVATIFGENPKEQIHEDLRNFKTMMENGGNATTGGPSSFH